jgi:hypothetical protein
VTQPGAPSAAHDLGVTSVALLVAEPVSLEAATAWLEELLWETHAEGPEVLRLKVSFGREIILGSGTLRASNTLCPNPPQSSSESAAVDRPRGRFTTTARIQECSPCRELHAPREFGMCPSFKEPFLSPRA